MDIVNERRTDEHAKDKMGARAVAAGDGGDRPPPPLLKVMQSHEIAVEIRKERAHSREAQAQEVKDRARDRSARERALSECESSHALTHVEQAALERVRRTDAWERKLDDVLKKLEKRQIKNEQRERRNADAILGIALTFSKYAEMRKQIPELVYREARKLARGGRQITKQRDHLTKRVGDVMKELRSLENDRIRAEQALRQMQLDRQITAELSRDRDALPAERRDEHNRSREGNRRAVHNRSNEPSRSSEHNRSTGRSA